MQKNFFRSSSVVLNGTHILVDGLYDSVPLLLSFMALSFGAGEKDAGLIVSLAALWAHRWDCRQHFFPKNWVFFVF